MMWPLQLPHIAPDYTIIFKHACRTNNVTTTMSSVIVFT